MASRFVQHIVLLSLLLLLLFLGDLLLGSVQLDVGAALSDQDSGAAYILWSLRLPKAITAVLAGCSLSLSGLLMQTLFRNPLADPYVLGISSGASLMVALVIMAGSSLGLGLLGFAGKGLIVVAAIAGSFMVTLLIAFVARKIQSSISLLLIGLMLGQVAGAFQSLLEYFSAAQSLKSFVIWGMGSLGNTTTDDLWLFVPVVLLLVVGTFSISKTLNALLLGENYAQNLGIDLPRQRLVIILITAGLTGITTAFCGPIAFVGIAIPISARLLFKSANHRHQIAYVLLLGSITLLACDIVCNISLKDTLLPINTITTLFGAPVVIYLMFKRKFSA